MKKLHWPDAVFWIAVIMITAFFVCCVVTGCQTAKNLPRHNDKFPVAAAAYSHKTFPCVTGDTIINVYSDSTQYLQSIEDLNTTILWLNDINDSLLREILKPTSTADTVCKKYEAAITAMQQRIQQLQNQIKSTKPVIEYKDKIVPVTDSSLIKPLLYQLADKTAKLDRTEDRLNWWKVAALIAFGIIGIAVAFKIGTLMKKSPL